MNNIFAFRIKEKDASQNLETQHKARFTVQCFLFMSFAGIHLVLRQTLRVWLWPLVQMLICNRVLLCQQQHSENSEQILVFNIFTELSNLKNLCVVPQNKGISLKAKIKFTLYIWPG